MLERLIDSSQRNETVAGGRVRLLADAPEHRLWIAGDPLSSRSAQAGGRGGVSGGPALIAAPTRRLSVWVAGVIGRS